MDSQIYRRPKASDMLESVLDSIMILEEEYNRIGKFYPDVFYSLPCQSYYYSTLNQFRQWDNQTRGYIKELRMKGL